jgi:hypothetical protein
MGGQILRCESRSVGRHSHLAVVHHLEQLPDQPERIDLVVVAAARKRQQLGAQGPGAQFFTLSN